MKNKYKSLIIYKINPSFSFFIGHQFKTFIYYQYYNLLNQFLYGDIYVKQT